MSEDDRNVFLANMPPIPHMTPEDLENFKRTFAAPMMWRHQELFSGMNRLGLAPSRTASIDETPPPAARRLVKNLLCVLGVFA
jgi:hypothetical protein